MHKYTVGGCMCVCTLNLSEANKFDSNLHTMPINHNQLQHPPAPLQRSTVGGFESSEETRTTPMAVNLPCNHHGHETGELKTQP